MKYNFKKESDISIQLRNNNHLKHIKWMEFILRRSDEVGKVELPIEIL